MREKKNPNSAERLYKFFYLFSFNNACSQYYYSGGMGVYGIH